MGLASGGVAACGTVVAGGVEIGDASKACRVLLSHSVIIVEKVPWWLPSTRWGLKDSISGGKCARKKSSNSKAVALLRSAGLIHEIGSMAMSSSSSMSTNHQPSIFRRTERTYRVTEASVHQGKSRRKYDTSPSILV